MKILFVSEDLVAGNLAYLLKKESHQIKLYIHDKKRRGNFNNMVEKNDNWKKELKWVGKEGLIIFDGCSFGSIQNKLRSQGFSVVGSSKLGNKLENDREYGNKIFKEYGLSTVPQINFDSINKAISFIKNNKKKWVIKQNSTGTSLKSFNYVGMMNNAEDVIDVLTNYKTETQYKDAVITLQEKIEGVEIGVGRYFNGSNWVGPIEINMEHKKYFPGDLGPTTSEMGTLAWYDDNEDNKLFKLTLAKLKNYLKEVDFRGDMEINCIVNKKGAFPLEATPRFGSPIVHLQSEIHITPWGTMLKALATGEDFKVKWRKGYGIVVVVTVPTSQPFPFTKTEHHVSPKGLKIYFDKVAKKNMEHIHFEDVSIKKVQGQDEYYISDDRGYVLYVTAVEKTVEKARKKVYNLLKHIHIPKMFYRNDIGLKFIESERLKLQKWGYLK
jgi:phosphoribosylamine---glycine ligase